MVASNAIWGLPGDVGWLNGRIQNTPGVCNVLRGSDTVIALRKDLLRFSVVRCDGTLNVTCTAVCCDGVTAGCRFFLPCVTCAVVICVVEQHSIPLYV